jgi:hypothetical protein
VKTGDIIRRSGKQETLGLLTAWSEWVRARSSVLSPQRPDRRDVASYRVRAEIVPRGQSGASENGKERDEEKGG